MQSNDKSKKLGKNTGKKYKKVDYSKGTDYSRDRADEFAHWYGQNYERLYKHLIYRYKWDEDVAQDTFLKIYDAIRYKGLKFDLDSVWYYLRSYHTNYLQKQEQAGKKRHSDVSEAYTLESRKEAPTVDPWEETKKTILAYINFEYGERDEFIYQAYIEQQPISVAKLAKVLGIPYGALWKTIKTISEDVAKRMDARGNFK